LEAVYEEKNRGLDNDDWKVYEKLSELLFKEHPYGTQTVIGTIEHLKNPSMTEIIKYFRKYYVPNNMAVCLSGDLDFTKTIQLIDKHLGKLPRKEDPQDNFPSEKPITRPMHADVFGPSAESLMMGFRVHGRNHPDFRKAKLASLLLSNQSVGLIDLNLIQQQKLLEAFVYIDDRNDYGIFSLFGKPRQNQSLEEVRDLLLGQIQLLKNGEFDESVIPAIITNLRVQELKKHERNGSRAHAFVEAFGAGMPWADYVAEIDELAKITKAEIVEYANRTFAYNYACVFKKTGEDPNKQSVEKPQITKVEVNRDAESAFIKTLKAVKVAPVQPLFLDYEKDITKSKLKNGLEVLYSENKENKLFQLSYIWQYGTNNDPKLDVLFQYLNYLGSEKTDAEAFKNKLFALGCNFYAYAVEKSVYVTVSGLSENMPQAVALVDELLNAPKANDEALQNVVADIIKQREDTKKEKESILFSGMSSYLYFGEKNPANSGVKNADLEKINSAELFDLLKKCLSYKHIIAYYGPEKVEKVIADVEKNRKLSENPADAPERQYFVEVENKEPIVYWYDFDMVQAELLFCARLGQYDKNILPKSTMYNEYFGGGMNSIVFQEMRESRALAYSVSASFRTANSLKNYNTFRGYIGTQADKLADAMAGMTDIIINMPTSEKAFETAKKNLLSRYETERITKQMKIYSFINAREMGNTYDIRKDIYEKCKVMTLKDVKDFQEKNIKNLKFSIAVIGSKDKLNFDVLKKYGRVVELNFEQVFGY
jgi:predicted Zn-dependent peptidase